MNNPAAKKTVPARAMASVLFACLSFVVFCAYGAVHWWPVRLASISRNDEAVLHQALKLTGPLRGELDIAYRILAVIALIWCIWSWRTEPRYAAIVATVFAALAMLTAVFIVI